MASSVSSTDVKLFLAASNTDLVDKTMAVDEIAAHVRRHPKSRAPADDDDGEEEEAESGDEGEDEEGSEEGDESEGEDGEQEEDDGEQEEDDAEQKEDDAEEKEEVRPPTRSVVGREGGRSRAPTRVSAAPRSDTSKSSASSAARDACVARAQSSSGFSDHVHAYRQTGHCHAGADVLPPRAAAPSSYAQHWSSPPLATPSRARDEQEDLMLEKQSVLHELRSLARDRRVQLSKEYTLDDRLEDMRFEMKRHLLDIEERDAVAFMRDSMRMAFAGIEIANSKLGPFLDLDGWAASAGGSIDKYDTSLSRLYRKYWKRSNSSPEMNIAFGILGSIGMYHFRKSGAMDGMMGGMMGGMMKGATMKGASASGARPGDGAASRGARPGKHTAREDSSDDEDLPESFK